MHWVHWYCSTPKYWVPSCGIQKINGRSSGSDWLEVATIYFWPIYIRPKFQGISPHILARNIVQSVPPSIGSWRSPIEKTKHADLQSIPSQFHNHNSPCAKHHVILSPCLIPFFSPCLTPSSYHHNLRFFFKYPLVSHYTHLGSPLVYLRPRLEVAPPVVRTLQGTPIYCRLT